MTKKYLAFIATSLFISGSVFSQGDNGGQNVKTEDDLQLNTITSAVPFLQIVTDSRSGAMGDAGTALSPTYASTFWNTSMLSFSEDDGAIGLSYSPWLRSITNDVSISTLSGYKQLNGRSTVGGSLRYFNLGEITFTDENAMETRTHVPQEFEILGAYAFKLNEEFSLGLNGKFIYSNLTAGQSAPGSITTPGIAGAADLSFSYFNQNVKYGSTNGALAFGLTVNNLGNKIQYTTENDRDFLPTNLKLGAALTFDIDKFNTITWNTDISKLLIPTPPTYVNLEGGSQVLASGMDPNVGVIAGILQSFYDAPGVLATDENGDFIVNDAGEYETVKGTRLKEELAEIMIGTGGEWWYNDVFAARAGFFYENLNKGSRQHFTFGVGLKYNTLKFDFSYLVSLRQQSPLSNTLRFSLAWAFGNSYGAKGEITD
ncbi:hypothetical protein SAMN05216474_2252 [Lishizhenia tianjinensis]|uniref:Type IX secretion system protein PorV domain-containing protein n=1 Tax=Lishizhenia tianjinensis TaxID=477690 RepID=A0A1I7AN60_9FLAO|nr:type IX secretion system outer membrane channel protein PorV [Lishizhenia tianjinensis]SFT76389.1 hypothetical protein SAMN05216474_2252 [Lishizhenia tianjinensis]